MIGHPATIYYAWQQESGPVFVAEHNVDGAIEHEPRCLLWLDGRVLRLLKATPRYFGDHRIDEVAGTTAVVVTDGPIHFVGTGDSSFKQLFTEEEDMEKAWTNMYQTRMNKLMHNVL